MSSPYKEDAPPPDPTGSTARKAPFGVTTPVSTDGRNVSWGDGNYNQNHPVNQPTTNHNIDHNTFGGTTKGWGTNKEHSYSCSKCHQPHNSGLPRLLQSNCLNYTHRGGRTSTGIPWAADKQYGYDADSEGREHRGYPIGSIYGGQNPSPVVEATMACHVGRSDQSPPLPAYNSSQPPSAWPDGNLWNNKTPWSQ
jgi:hypothetical protein